MKTRLVLLLPAAFAAAAAQPMTCDLGEYKAAPGLRAEMSEGALRLTWLGARGQELRASFGIDNGVPMVRELAARKANGAWAALGRDLAPEFQVTSGVRRISEQQLSPLRKLGLMSPEFLEQEKWKVFWDAPLNVPGSARTNPGLPRQASEIRRAAASFHATGCKVKTDGARLEVSFDGLSMGIFSGRLQFTAYKGTNLLRQEAIAQTAEPSVAYKYSAGLKGFRTEGRRVIWRDVARGWQKCEFGGSPNADPVALRARNRLAIVEGASGSLAVFPAPHKFFFAREIELNLGYVWYRKDDAGSFSVGVRQADHEEMYRPFGFSDEVWQRRSRQARGFADGNFALYNAPPGTWQRMAVYYYLSPEAGPATQESALAFTHDDRYKALPGYQVGVGHFHTHFNEQVTDAGSIDFQPPWIPTFRALGINIAMMSDFHGDGHPEDPGALRFADQKVYFDACRRHSDRDFLIMPGEEPDAFLGGHYTMGFPKPVFWTHVRKEGQTFEENHPRYGKVYHVGSAADELEMLRKESGLVWQAHPRTKGSAGYPDAIRETEHFRSDRYLGGSFQSLPGDLSQSRLCEVRCLGLLDDMNNWTGPKYLVAEGDTYAKFPDDETYPHLLVNYIKVDRLPGFDQDWSPILKAMRAGDFFVTSCEVLIKQFTAAGGAVEAEIEWTFPLEFVEVVWGDGQKTDRKVIPATEYPPFGSHRFRIPLEMAGKKWVRFAAWDSAGNGAVSQPVHVKSAP
ncbi:MAG: hypothetical protein HY013_08735 [Candidatus Solibacter usitatus]|nr:hypothetical protein [Candidatus Solibacter usitatus]